MFDFKKLLNEFPVGVVVINSDEEIIFSNNAVTEIFGFTYDEIDYLGQWFEKVFPDKDKRDKARNYYYKKMAGNLNKDYFEIRTKMRKRKYIDFEINKIEKDFLLISILDITEKIEYRKEIEYLSFHDELTGLYNRRFFNIEFDRLNNSRKYPISLIVADINGLKEINDKYGHKMGDKFIKKSAEILENCLREEDILARIGGDEFMILLSETDNASAKFIANRIKEEFKQNNSYNILPERLDIAVGISTAINREENLNKHLIVADNSMYKNKEVACK